MSTTWYQVPGTYLVLKIRCVIHVVYVCFCVLSSLQPLAVSTAVYSTTTIMITPISLYHALDLGSKKTRFSSSSSSCSPPRHELYGNTTSAREAKKTARPYAPFSIKRTRKAVRRTHRVHSVCHICRNRLFGAHELPTVETV